MKNLRDSLYALDSSDFIVFPNWQVLYHTPKSSFSYWDEEHGSHIFSTQDLPFFVCSMVLCLVLFYLVTFQTYIKWMDDATFHPDHLTY
jgi:hypothetical protein